MRSIEDGEIKEIELELLEHIDRLCRENGLRYYLCGGTLLGAVRHEGFIPWDDDIDISMPRPDYERLLSLAEEEGILRVLRPGGGYYYNFAKLADKRTRLTEPNCRKLEGLGVYVDIFPLEGMPEKEGARAKHFRRLNRLRKRIVSYSRLAPQPRKNLLLYAKELYIYYIRNRLTPLARLQESYKRLALRYTYEDASWVYASGGAYGERDIFEKRIFGEGCTRGFEGHAFSAPADPHAYLCRLYGDYMRLPPIEKRVSCHGFTAEYLEEEGENG